MTNDKKLAVNVFNDDNTKTGTPEQQTQPQNETKTEMPAEEKDVQKTTTQQSTSNTEKNDALPTYFIYGGVIVGLLILLALLVVIRKLNKKQTH